MTDQSLAVGYTAEDLELVPEMADFGGGLRQPHGPGGPQRRRNRPGPGLRRRASTSSWRPKRSEQRGRVIGVDMTEDMVARGRQLAQEHGFGNVEFRLGDIAHLPVDSGTMEVIISNCVINLTPDKLASFKEMHRVLKPGGRILIADLVTAGDLPPDVRASAAAWADCLAGALEKEQYLETIRRAGFGEVSVVSESRYGAPGMDMRLQGKILSVKVRAFKR